MNVSLDLKMEIVRLQVEQGLGEVESSSKIAALIKSSRAEIEKEVQVRLVKALNSQLLVRLNKMRKSVFEKGFEEGSEFVREKESHFRVNCKNCSKPMHFSSDKSNWAETTKILDKAFENWTHVDCSLS